MSGEKKAVPLRMSGETEQNAASANLLALADRCEKASGPNFQLEQEIGAAVFPKRADLYPPFTASLDAAMTLKPNGLGLYLRYGAFTSEQPLAEVHLTKTHTQAISEHGHYAAEYDIAEGRAAAPALALCAAALRARATLPSPVKEAE